MMTSRHWWPMRKQDDDLAALVANAAAVSAGRGRLPRVREVTLQQLRVRAAQVLTPYVQRDVQADAQAVGPGEAVLLVGHSMAGKTRLAAEVIRSSYPDHPVLVAESGKTVRALVAGKWNPAGVVVWLDDLERFLGADGLTVGVLHALTGGEAIVLGTIGAHAMDAYRPTDQLHLPEWEVLAAFTQINLERGLSQAELDRVRLEVTDPNVLAAVQRYGLAEYLGAGPEALDKFMKGAITQPVGYALVRGAADWRRTGLSHPIPKTILVTQAMASIYLAQRPDIPQTEQALQQGLEWATAKINETVALLSPNLTDPANATFEAFDYVVDYLNLTGTSIPDQLWQIGLQEAQPSEWADLGRTATRANNRPVAERALRKAAGAGDKVATAILGPLLLTWGEPDEAEIWCRKGAEIGDSDAMVLLGMLLAERRESDEAEVWWRKAAQSGHAKAMLELGVLLDGRQESGEAEFWWRKAAQAGNRDALHNVGVLLERREESAEAEAWYRKAADAGHSGAMHNLGLLLLQRGNEAEAEVWWLKAADAGHSKAMHNLGVLHERRGDSAEAAVWYQRAAEARS